MKKLFCALLAGFCILSIVTSSLGENTALPAATGGSVQLVTPTPSAEPSGILFSEGSFRVTLPAGMEMLDEAQREAYDAAVQADYPDASRILLAAVSADADAAICFFTAPLEPDAATAAREAAQTILNSTVTVSDVQYGSNSYASFRCAIGEQIYTLYYLDGEAEMLIVGISGLEESEIERMLTGLQF